MKWIAASLLGWGMSSGSASAGLFPQVVDTLDVKSYMGRWYEIASTQPSFQKDCVCVTADYSLQANGRVKVVNSCRKKSPDGLLDQVAGEAAPTGNPAKFKVDFGGFNFPFSNYWVVDLAEDYSFAVVSTFLRKPIWILARSPQIAGPALSAIQMRLANRGFNVEKISLTSQADCRYTAEAAGQPLSSR